MTRLVIPFLAVALALPAQAQLITRDKPKPGAAAKDKDAKSDDDDDILAPKKDDKKPQPVDDKPADNKPKAYTVGLVAIVPVGEAGKTLADKVTQGLQKELGSGHVFDAVPLAVTVAGGAVAVDEAAAQKALADGKAALDKGRAQLDKLQMGKAKALFDLARDSFVKAAGALADPQPLIDAHVGLAEVAARQGQDSDAEAELMAAAALNPEKNLDKKKYPGAFITTYDKARDKLMKDKRGTVIVDATGAGASVEIDGRPLQGAPLTINNVPIGKHVVRAVREGLPSYGVIVDVKAGESVTVSPGYIAKDGHSYLDDLQNNRLSPEGAKALAEAAKAAGYKGVVVGVVSKSSGNAPTQLVLVDAATGGMIKLPLLGYTESMLDISIETLKARDAVEAAFDAAKAPFASDAIAVLIEGAKAGAGATMATVALRYDVTPLKAPSRSRLLTDDKPKDDEDTVASDDETGDKKILAAGKSGTRKRLDDEEDPYASHDNKKTSAPDPDAPITEQGWFWPTVLGGGASAIIVVGGATVLTLIATKVIPDPRPANGAEIHVALP